MLLCSTANPGYSVLQCYNLARNLALGVVQTEVRTWSSSQPPAEYQKPVDGSPEHLGCSSEALGHVGSLGSVRQYQGKGAFGEDGLYTL